jgi:hypothetical protein
MSSASGGSVKKMLPKSQPVTFNRKIKSSGWVWHLMPAASAGFQVLHGFSLASHQLLTSFGYLFDATVSQSFILHVP